MLVSEVVYSFIVRPATIIPDPWGIVIESHVTWKVWRIEREGKRTNVHLFPRVLLLTQPASKPINSTAWRALDTSYYLCTLLDLLIFGFPDNNVKWNTSWCNLGANLGIVRLVPHAWGHPFEKEQWHLDCKKVKLTYTCGLVYLAHHANVSIITWSPLVYFNVIFIIYVCKRILSMFKS